MFMRVSQSTLKTVCHFCAVLLVIRDVWSATEKWSYAASLNLHMWKKYGGGNRVGLKCKIAA